MTATPMTVAEFVRSVCASGAMTVEEVKSFLGCLALDRRPANAEQLAREMVSRGKLTPFQARAVLQQKAMGLATRVEEKRLVLSAASKIPDEKAVAFVTKAAADPQLAAMLMTTSAAFGSVITRFTSRPSIT